MNAPASTEQFAPEALHQPFSWLHDSIKHDPNAKFAAMVKTFCSGTASVLSILHSNNMAIANDEAPLLSAFDADALMLMAGATVQMLHDTAERRIDSLWDRANPLPTTSGSKK